MVYNKAFPSVNYTIEFVSWRLPEDNGSWVVWDELTELWMFCLNGRIADTWNLICLVVAKLRYLGISTSETKDQSWVFICLYIYIFICVIYVIYAIYVIYMQGCIIACENIILFQKRLPFCWLDFLFFTFNCYIIDKWKLEIFKWYNLMIVYM